VEALAGPATISNATPRSAERTFRGLPVKVIVAPIYFPFLDGLAFVAQVESQVVPSIVPFESRQQRAIVCASDRARDSMGATRLD
jgi:hypothetical protein